jgi:hypothetical protein
MNAVMKCGKAFEWLTNGGLFSSAQLHRDSKLEEGATLCGSCKNSCKNIPQDRILHSQRRRNLKSYLLI